MRSLFLPAAASLALVAIAACATSPEPDLSPLTNVQDSGATTLPPEEASDAGSTPPPKQTGTDAGPKDSGTKTPPDGGGGGNVDAGPGACDLSDPFQAFVYSIEASNQSQPDPCPCADPSTQCCYQGQTCVDL